MGITLTGVLPSVHSGNLLKGVCLPMFWHCAFVLLVKQLTRKKFKKMPATFGPQYKFLTPYTLYSCKCVWRVAHSLWPPLEQVV